MTCSSLPVRTPCDEDPTWGKAKAIFEKDVHDIFDLFLAETGKLQVCLKSKTRFEVIEMLKSPNIYIFDCTCPETAATLSRDLLPRFRQSHEFAELLLHSSSTSSLFINPPATTLHLAFILEVQHLPPTLEQAMADNTLFMGLYRFLAARFCAENLLFVRAVTQFDLLFYQNDHPKGQAKEFAWKIYRLFLVHGSPRQISANTQQLKQIGMKLAAPELSMFAAVKAQTEKLLRVQFNEYLRTADYTTWVSQTKQRVKKRQQRGRSCWSKMRYAVCRSNNTVGPVEEPPAIEVEFPMHQLFETSITRLATPRQTADPAARASRRKLREIKMKSKKKQSTGSEIFNL
jgi:hypothetical protein